MASDLKGGTRNDRPSIAEEIIRFGKQAFDPAIPEQIRVPNIQAFDSQLGKIGAPALLPVLNYLVQPGRVFPWLQKPLISTLAQLPLRAGGVQDTIEFILSVHPSTTDISPSHGERRPSISHEALNTISQLISLPPAGIPADIWFNGIAPQLLSLLQTKGNCEMEKVAAYVIGFGILGRRNYGSPGSPGWKAFIEPIHTSLYPRHSSLRINTEYCDSSDNVERVGFREIYSTPSEVANGLKRLTNLVTSHPHPSLTVRVLKPILYSLWTLSSWPNGTEQTEILFRGPARNLLTCLLRLSLKSKDCSKISLLDVILDDYISEGQNFAAERGWSFMMIEDGGIQIEKIQSDLWKTNYFELTDVDIAADNFIDIMREHSELETDISALFMRLCTKWLTQNSQLNHTKAINLSKDFTHQPPGNRVQLVEAKIMQKMIAMLPDKLIHNSTQLLKLICQILKDCSGSANDKIFNQDAVSISLSLLNCLINSSSFRVSKEIEPLMGSIEIALESLSRKNYDEISITSKNLLMLLRLRDVVFPLESIPSDQESRKIARSMEERKSYNLALSYISAPDSPPPVRVQGLDLLSCLFRDNSPILDIPALIQIISSLLEDDEEYVHLRALNLLVQVAQRHQSTVTKDILNRYVDSNEEYNLDIRLRLGEALQQIVQVCNISLKSETTEYLFQGLLLLGGRRGHRRKTEMYQEKMRLIKKDNDSEDEEKFGGSGLNFDEYLDSDPEAQDFIFQIVSGWESKRGTEDVRIRSSAITILGTLILSNIQGLRSKSLSAALDLSVHVLTLERGIEKGILRRAAVILVVNFIQALDSARSEGKYLGFGILGQGLTDLQKVLEYTEKTDNDDLVRQHSRDAIESLNFWSMKSLLPREPESINIQSLNSLTSIMKNPKEFCARPKIVEVD